MTNEILQTIALFVLSFSQGGGWSRPAALGATLTVWVPRTRPAARHSPAWPPTGSRGVRPPLDPQLVARPPEDPSDVRGDVAEVVPRIRRPVHPVQHPAPVRVEQPPDQGAWVEVDQFLLPGDKLDPALVLAPGSMLREQARPVLGVRGDFGAADLGRPADLVRQHLGHGALTSLDKSWVSIRTDDPQPEYVAVMRGDAAVSEVETQEVGVCALWKPQWIAAADVTTPGIWRWSRSHTVKVRDTTAPPVQDGSSWDPGLACDLTVIPSRSDQLQGEGNFRS